ncbi:MAG: hypothetical protein ACE37D_09465 [Pseudomonadales bacterium]
MTPLLMFNSTILVLWVTLFIPDALKNGNHRAVWISTAVILALEIWLCLEWAEREFPTNLIAAFAITILALMTGRVAHLINQKMDKEES